MKTFYWLLKRETWEHRSFLIVPATLGAVALFFMLIGFAQMLIGMDGITHDMHSLFSVTEQNRERIAKGVLGTSMPFTLVMWLLVVVYLLDALYGDRRDRSILFWKSLPISDTTVVLSKLATAVLVVPAITIVVVAATQLGVLSIASIGFLAVGVDGWGWMWNPLGWLQGWIWLGYTYVLFGLALLPYMGWLLLASSWARRTPFLWAAVPPIALMIFERWFIGTHHLADLVFGHLHRVLDGTINLFPHDSVKNSLPDHGFSISTPGFSVFARPAFWGGLLAAGLFVTAAIWVRRYRDET